MIKDKFCETLETEIREQGLEADVVAHRIFVMDSAEGDLTIISVIASIAYTVGKIGPPVLTKLVDWILKRRAGHKFELKKGDMTITLENCTKKEIESLIEEYKEDNPDDDIQLIIYK